MALTHLHEGLMTEQNHPVLLQGLVLIQSLGERSRICSSAGDPSSYLSVYLSMHFLTVYLSQTRLCR